MEFEQIAMENRNVFREEVVVNLDTGLHLVPCSQISQLARDFECDIRIYNGDHRVDAKTVFDLMTLRAEQGTHLIIEAEGDGSEEAIQKLAHLFETDFEINGTVR